MQTVNIYMFSNERFESNMNILNTLYGNLELISQGIRKNIDDCLLPQWCING